MALRTMDCKTHNERDGHDTSGERPLTSWHNGEEGVIVDVDGSPRLVARLREVGVLTGARIRVLRAGCPIIIQVEEGRFCLRKRNAACIRVQSTSVQIPQAAAPVPDLGAGVEQGAWRGPLRRWRHRRGQEPAG